MKSMLAALSLLIAVAVSGSVLAGHLPGHHHGPGCQQPCCQPDHICVPKVEKKPIKKTVYEVKCVPVCEHAPGKLHGCDCCPTCNLYYKKVLIKKEIECGEKCEVVCEPVPACQPVSPSKEGAEPVAAPAPANGQTAQPVPAPEPAPLKTGR